MQYQPVTSWDGACIGLWRHELIMWLLHALTTWDLKFKFVSDIPLPQLLWQVELMRLCHPPDGSTSSKYKLLCFKPP